MIDKYFKNPLFWDYFIGLFIITFVKSLLCFDKLSIPSNNIIFSISSDISNISFTSAGFIITLTTVLVTFKGGSRITKENYDSTNSIFELFFVSDLYFDTIKHLKNCIKSLIILSVLGYIIKLFFSCNKDEYLFLYCVMGILIIAITLWRCLLILTKILNLQKQK